MNVVAMHELRKQRSLGALRNIDYSDPIVRYRGRKVHRLAKILVDKEKISFTTTTAVDVFYTFYLPYPILADPLDIANEEGRASYRIVSSMLSSKHVHDIRGKCVADSLLSSIAAGIFLSELERQVEGMQQKSLNDKKSMDSVSENTIKSSVDKALSIARNEIESVRKLRYVIEGQQPGTVSMMAQEEYAVELIKLARNTEVRKILELISGAKPWFINIPRRKWRSKHGEITGYELGRDIERIVASNLALPDDLFYLRLLEGRLLLNQKVLSQSSGPLYVLVDKCLPGDTLVYTPAGAVEIGSLRPGDRVYTVGFKGSAVVYGVADVLAVGTSGVKEVYRVVTPVGDLRATWDHMVPVLRDGVIEEKPVYTVDEGDYLVVPLFSQLGGGALDRWGSLDALAGVIIGVISSSRRIRVSMDGLVLSFNSPSKLEVFKPVIESFGWSVYRGVVYVPEGMARVIAIKYPRLIADAVSRRLPLSDLISSAVSLRSFIGTVIALLGETSANEVTLPGLGRVFAKQLQYLMLVLGIPAGVKRRPGGLYAVTIGPRVLFDSRLHAILAPVRDVIYEGKVPVYDIGVSWGHRLVAEGFIVHNSGSMDGIKMVWAKAVALSLYMRATREHREFYFRFFDSIPYPLIKLERRPSVRDVLKLMDYIASVKGSGGTDISRALMLACSDIKSGVTRNASDIVLITDGVDRIAESLVMHNLKKANARLISVMIHGDNRSLKRLSSKYFTVKKLDVGEMLKVIEA